MTVLQILQILAAILTILTGLISLIVPRSVQGFTGLKAPGPRGLAEIRAILGGAFIGLGLLVAIPLIIVHSYLEGRLNVIRAHLEDITVSLIKIWKDPQEEA